MQCMDRCIETRLLALTSKLGSIFVPSSGSFPICQTTGAPRGPPFETSKEIFTISRRLLVRRGRACPYRGAVERFTRSPGLPQLCCCYWRSPALQAAVSLPPSESFDVCSVTM